MGHTKSRTFFTGVTADNMWYVYSCGAWSVDDFRFLESFEKRFQEYERPASVSAAAEVRVESTGDYATAAANRAVAGSKRKQH